MELGHVLSRTGKKNETEFFYSFHSKLIFITLQDTMLNNCNYILLMADETISKHQRFRRTQSALETSAVAACRSKNVAVCSSQSASRLPETLNSSNNFDEPVDSTIHRKELPSQSSESVTLSGGNTRTVSNKEQYNNEDVSHSDDDDDDPLQDISDIQLYIVSKSASDANSGAAKPEDGNCELKTKTSSTVISDVSESDSEDDQTRSRTPLLARHSSLEQKQKVSCTTSDSQVRRRDEISITNSSGHKRVSFSTRSLDGQSSERQKVGKKHRSHGGKPSEARPGSQDHGRKSRKDGSKSVVGTNSNIGKSVSGVHMSPDSPSRSGSKPHSKGLQHSSSNDTNDESIQHSKEMVADDGIAHSPDSASNERRFVLVPQNDSMVGWNQAGGPFPSQWLFQAVNVAVKKFTSTMQPPGSSTGGTVVELNYSFFLQTKHCIQNK